MTTSDGRRPTARAAQPADGLGDEHREHAACSTRHDRRIKVADARSLQAFNYSASNNLAAKEARGDILLLLNNDVEVIGPEWLDEMVAQVSRPEVGIVGAKLLYADGRVQHAGALRIGAPGALARDLAEDVDLIARQAPVTARSGQLA